MDFAYSSSTLKNFSISLGVIISPLETTVAEICSTRIFHFLSLDFGRKGCRALCMARLTGTALIGAANTVVIAAAAFQLIGCVYLE